MEKQYRILYQHLIEKAAQLLAVDVKKANNMINQIKKAYTKDNQKVYFLGAYVDYLLFYKDSLSHEEIEKGYSNYFAIGFFNNGSIMNAKPYIFNGLAVLNQVKILRTIVDKNELQYSAHKHDFIQNQNGSFLDGGCVYHDSYRFSNANELRQVLILDGSFYLVNDEFKEQFKLQQLNEIAENGSYLDLTDYFKANLDLLIPIDLIE